MADAAAATPPRPGAPPADVAARRRRRSRSPGSACCRCSGRCVLFIAWDLVVRLGFIKPILLPTPLRRRSARSSPAWPAGRCCTTSRVTVLRTLQAFLIAAVHRRAARRAARQQREGVPQRRVPDRLLPLDAVVGADPAVPADLRRLRHQQGRDRRVRRAADRRLQQRLRRHQRAQAARDGGAGDGRVALADLQGRADLGEPAADASSACARRCRWRS